MRQFIVFLYLICTINLVPIDLPGQESLIVQRAKKDIELTGFTRSKKVISISSEVSGRVLSVNYDVGQVIGQKSFINIDPTFINFQIESTRESINKLNILIQQSESNIEYLKKEFLRVDALHKGDRATGVKRDASENQLIQATHDRRALIVEKSALDISLQELIERKKRHTIYAPKGWIVVERSLEPREIISPNIPLARVADYRRLIVPLSVSGEEYAVIKKLGKEFKAKVENTLVTASVNWVNPEFNETTRKLSIELIINNYKGEKRGGLSFKFPLQLKTKGLLIPKKAVTNRYDNPRVTISNTGEVVNILILDETNDGFVIADNEKLPLNTILNSGN